MLILNMFLFLKEKELMNRSLIFALLTFLMAPFIAFSQVEEKVESIDVVDQSVAKQVHVLDLEITKYKNRQEEIEIIKTSSHAGHLDESKLIYPPRKVGKIVVHFLDSKHELIEEIVVKEPYLQTLKKYDEGEDVNTNDDAVETEKISIHFNENPRIKSMKIFKLKNENMVEIFHHYFVR